MYHKRLLAGLLLAALCLALSLLPAFASVGLSYFNAAATADKTIMLTWETATEENTIGFKLYRSTSESPSDWGSEIHTEPSRGSAQGGDLYTYEDTNSIAEGVTYYYLLREVTSNNTLTDLQTASAAVGLPTNTPTPTDTPTGGPTPTPTWTPQPTVTRYASPTLTVPAPTATRKYTDAPPTPVPSTPTPRLPATATAYRAPTATPLPLARVASPTGPAPIVTAPAAPMPTFTPVVIAPAQPDTPTPALLASAEGPEETATALPTKDVTPIIFSAETQGRGSPTPQSATQVAEQGSSSLALIIGGSAVGLAAVLAAVVLFLRSRRA